MGRRSSRGSVYNKRANEQVQSAQTSSGGGGFIPQAHAQSAQNPTQGRQPQANAHSNQQQDPWARASQFAYNVGRGAADTGRSYTTDFYDMAEATVTGRDRKEKSYEDETLAGVFGRGLFEGNLEGSWDEAGRRIKEEPGRVVGEVAAEAAILAASMGFGAVAKGARIGYFATSKLPKIAKNYKSVRGATKADGTVGYTRKTGWIRKGTEEKYIGNKRTTITTVNRKGVEKFRTKRTNVLDRLEKFGITHGERFGNKIGRPTRLGNPMIIGASGKALGAVDDLPKNMNIDDIPGASITKGIATRNNPATAITPPSKFTSQTVKLEKSFINYDQGVDPRFMKSDAPVEQVFNQGQEFSFGGRFPGVAPEMSNIRRIASFTEKDGSVTTARTLQEFEALKNRLNKSDIEKITYDYPKGRISASSKESLVEGTAKQINSNDVFLQSGSGTIDTSPSIVFQKVDDAILKASGEGKNTVETVNIRNQYLNFYKQEAGRNTELSSPVLNIKQGVKVSDKDEIVSDTAEGVFFNTKKDPLEDMHRLGSLEGDEAISSVGQITSKTGRFQNIGFRATASKTEGGEQEAILNAFSPNAGSNLPYNLNIKPTQVFYSFSGTADGVKPILRNMPGSSGSAPIDVEKRFAKKFLETNTPGQDFRRLNIGTTGSNIRSDFVDVLTSQLIKKNKADPNNPQTTKVYKQVAETMAEKSYNIPIDDWLKQTNTLKKDAINIKLRNEPGVQYNAMALIDGFGVTDVWRVKNKLTAVKKEYLKKSMKGKGETRLDTGDPLGGTQQQKTPYELLVQSKVKKEVGLTEAEKMYIKRQTDIGYSMGGKKMGIPEPVRQPGNTNQNNPWFMGVSQAERKAKLKANIKARKEALAKAPKAKRRRRSKRNAPASKSITELSFGDNWEINDPSDILRSFKYNY
jgi:hypothetical protein